MKKSELLKLKPGKYLLTDDICNYTYELFKYENKETIICQIRERGSLSRNTISIHYQLIEDHEEDFNKYIPLMKFSCMSSIGGISIHKDGAYEIYSNLYLIGAYPSENFKDVFKRYIIHHKINLSKYDRKTFYKIKGTR